MQHFRGLSRRCLNLAKSKAPTNRTHNRFPARRTFAAESAANATAEAAVAETAAPTGMSMGKRLGLFAGFLGLGGLGTFSYVISVDEDARMKAYDIAPALVTFVAPMVGIPVDEETQEVVFQDISDVVGEKLFVLAELASGKVVALEADVHDSEDEVMAKIASKGGASVDQIVDLKFVDQDEMDKFEKMSSEQLQEETGAIVLPEIMPHYTKNDLRLLLEVARSLERDIQAQIIHANKYKSNVPKLERTMEAIIQRKVEIKQAIKNA